MSRNPPASWNVLLQGGGPDTLAALEELLDGLGPRERLSLLRRARPEHLQSLFELCRDRPLSEEHLVDGTPWATSTHDGVNTLPLFRHFQKRFFRTPSGVIAGYNPSAFNWAITPGYFCVVRDGGHLQFDYTSLPREVPDGWPPPIPNADKLGRFVYYGLRDDMRRVSRHVCIGAVSRHGQPIGTWFALCRREESP